MEAYNKKSEFIKQNKGITLIALVVTIIILLILAAVAINTMNGDNGIVRRAESSRGNYRYAEIDEEVYYDVSASKINKDAEVDENKLRNCLTKSFGEEGTDFTLEGDEIEGWTITIIENKSSYFVDPEGEIEKTEYEEPINNNDSLVLGFVDNLGTRAMIYLYANPDKCTEGETVTITDSQGNTLTNVDEEEQTTVKAVAKNGEGKLKITGAYYQDAKQSYIAYPVTQNGTYKFKATKTGVTTPTITTIRVKNIETFIAIEDIDGLEYCNSEKKAYNYKGAAVPKGYYVDTKSKVETGLVITDEIDSNGYSIGNEWVWVPVVENDDYRFHLTLASSENIYGTSIPYTNYSKLWMFKEGKNHQTTIENIASTQKKPSQNSGYREPTLVLGDDDESYDYSNYTNVYNRKSSPRTKFNASDAETNPNTVSDFAIQLRDDYDNMVKSVSDLGGFYIGRYEITANGEKPGKCLSRKTWYELYNECMFLNKGTNTETSMMYGTLWDATMKWLADKGYVVGLGNTTSGYGNYSSEEVKLTNNTTTITIKNDIFETGQTSYTKSNNIYDLSGNFYEWTQEAQGEEGRVTRGGYALGRSSGYTYSAYRYSNSSTNSRPDISSRSILFIK